MPKNLIFKVALALLRLGSSNRKELINLWYDDGFLFIASAEKGNEFFSSAKLRDY